MKTTTLIKQHQKCLKILEMIREVDGRVLFYLSRINKIGYISLSNKLQDKITEQKAIRSRLINYYANTFTKMCQNVNV